MITLTNTTDEEIIVADNLFRESGSANDSYEIPAITLFKWANDSGVIAKIADGSLLLSLNGQDITNVSEAIDVLKGVTPKKVESTNQPFAAKVLPNGKKIYRRVHGISATLDSATTTIDYIVPYTECKILGLEILNGKIGDTANFKVLDTAAGTLTGVPNYLLNQFGFDVNIRPESANYPSKYDADLFVGLVLRVVYASVVEDPERTIYINFDLHEIKD